MSAVFVTGTGTDVGKTFVTAALIRALRRRGRAVEALKPVASGFDPAEVAASDPGVLLAALGKAATIEALDRVAPWRYAAPLSPDMAARREGRKLDFAALVEFTRNAVSVASGFLFIEGVGGVMVPLDEDHTVLDWMAALGLPALLVGGSYLGAISHALTALDALGSRSLSVTAMVVDETPQSSVDLTETVDTIRRFAGGVPILALRRLAHENLTDDTVQRLTDLL